MVRSQFIPIFTVLAIHASGQDTPIMTTESKVYANPTVTETVHDIFATVTNTISVDSNPGHHHLGLTPRACLALMIILAVFGFCGLSILCRNMPTHGTERGEVVTNSNDVIGTKPTPSPPLPPQSVDEFEENMPDDPCVRRV